MAGLRADAPGAAGPLRGHGLSGRLAPRRQGRVGTRRGGRIEEHGLHLWMGFYENAFRLMRECYAELGRDPRTCPIAAWRDAFSPAPYVGVAEQRTRRRVGCRGRPICRRSRGCRASAHARPIALDVTDYIGRVVGLLRALLELVAWRRETPRRRSARRSARTTRLPPASPQLLKFGELATLAALIEGVELLETMLGDLAASPDNLILRLLDALAAKRASLLEARAALDLDVRRVWNIVDLTLATLRGIVRFRLATDPARLRRHRRLRLPRVAAPERRRRSCRSTPAICAASTTSASPTRTATSSGRASPPGRRCAAWCARSSPIAARSSGG